MHKDILNPQDVHSLSSKLEEFSANLPEQERNILDWLMARGQACTDKELAAVAAATELSREELDAVAGGAAGMPLDSKLASALGISPDADGGDDPITVSVMWSR